MVVLNRKAIILPVCLGLVVLVRRLGFVHFGVESFHIIKGGLSLNQSSSWYSRGWGAAQGKWRGRLAEVVDASVVWVAVVVFHVGKRGTVWGGVARAGLDVTWVIAVKEEETDEVNGQRRQGHESLSRSE